MDAKTFDRSELPSSHVKVALIANRHGEPIALVRDRDMITIDAIEGRFDLEGSEAELAGQRKRPANPYQSGLLRTYAEQMGAARKGAVTHAGGKAEVICYADI